MILAGGAGTRLGSLTRDRGKALLPIAGRPMILYALVTLMRAGLREIVVVVGPRDRAAVGDLLGDGAAWGTKVEYAVQERQLGIAHALLAAARRLEEKPCAVILADNLFLPVPSLEPLLAQFVNGALIFATRVSDVGAFGEVTLDASGRPQALREKPPGGGPGLAVPGLYVFDGRAAELAAGLAPSARGELEITDLNRRYLELGLLRVERLSDGVDWFDAGTPADLQRASENVARIEARDRCVIACPEAVALERGYVSPEQLGHSLTSWPDSAYKTFVSALLESRSFGGN